MKVVVLSDTHLSQVTPRLTEACERYCADADLVIHLGDWTRAVILDYFQQFPLEAVAGNMDDGVIRQQLPIQKALTLNGHRIGMAHGWGYESDMHRRLMVQFPDAKLILYGHTHRPMNRWENGVLFFNPGSTFHGRGGVSGSLGILHIGETIETDLIAL